LSLDIKDSMATISTDL